ncbi:LutC/YkgG family protein [Algoriphagus hitonicola]|uniref:L-lactate dehydrogenase complex protein LldG n=1 Tax=Algoriphagus hitonicola TaxID=435880 RepID=A0A1I2NG68_9BACT|nr:LUD domain-containing protein [Algoriphagus hitonicola]SFG02935.1 L-lactate dehydrogenase complex protein LldG [Algoriphagus hitonicola]
MNSRSIILEKLRTGNPVADKPLPEWNLISSAKNLVSGFKKAIEANKGEVFELSEFENWLKSQEFEQVLSISKHFNYPNSIQIPTDAHELAELNLAIIDGQFGTAENGAIWLDDKNLNLRALPFITEHLVIILSKKQLVATMHDAYKRIQDSNSGFGLFLAGPSKTADIEQSLVIGAHGAKSLRVVWCED